MKKQLGMSLLASAALSSLSAVQVGNTVEQVRQEKGVPPGRIVAGGFVILSYPDQTIWTRDGQVLRMSGPPKRLSVVPAPKPKPRPKPVPVWKDDLEVALAQAREQNHPVLVFLTGPDWAPRSTRLEQEIFSTPEFVEYANHGLILVKLEFPAAGGHPAEPGEPEAVTTNPLQKTASGVKSPTAKAKVDDFPAMLIFDSQGRAAGSLGYPENGVSAFVESLKRY